MRHSLRGRPVGDDRGDAGVAIGSDVEGSTQVDAIHGHSCSRTRRTSRYPAPSDQAIRRCFRLARDSRGAVRPAVPQDHRQKVLDAIPHVSHKDGARSPRRRVEDPRQPKACSTTPKPLVGREPRLGRRDCHGTDSHHRKCRQARGLRLTNPYPCGWLGSIQRTSSGRSAGSMSRLTTTGSWSLRTSTHSSGSSVSALISWCGT
jgi:hypothetical protein